MNDENESPRDEHAPEMQKTSLELNLRRILIGVAVLAACCAAAIAFGRIGWAASALTGVAAIGGAILACGVNTASKRPQLMRVVLAASGALAILVLQPVELIASLV